MCGVAGWITHADPHGRTAHSVRPEQLDRMIATLAHRGPDGLTTRIDGGVALAHARLAIVDLAHGTQPIGNEDGLIQVILNGEIFNHVELRAELELLGHRFRTHSDTEVLVHLYEEHGDDFLDRLNGQFALALHDRRRHRVLLARDRVGIRPLFYTHTPDRFAFASEAKALLTLPGVERAWDPAALSGLFNFWAPVAPRSPLAGISQLPPGHRMVVEAPGPGQPVRTRITRWWDWPFAEPEAPCEWAVASSPAASPGAAASSSTRSVRALDAAAEELRALLEDAVRLQLRADVPVGAYLSGGLDSSGLAALARRQLSGPLQTWALSFDDPSLDESAWQGAMAEHLGTEHHTLRVTPADICAALSRTVWHAESPLVRTAPAPMRMLAGLVRDHGGKVVLTGEGADEVFAGYDLFKEAQVRRFIARQPQSARRVRLWERLYPYLENSPTRRPALAQRFFGRSGDAPDSPWYAHRPRMDAASRIQQFFSDEMRERCAAHDPLTDLTAQLPEGFPHWAPLHRDQYVEAHTLLDGMLLSAQGDRMAMAHGVEGRVPYLDHRVVEFACRLPPRFKLQGLNEKAILKRALRDLVPPQILNRPKQPYRAPDSACFFEQGRLRDELHDLLTPDALRQAGVFDPDAVDRLVAKAAAGRAIGAADNMSMVAVVTTQMMHRQFIEAPELEPTA